MLVTQGPERTEIIDRQLAAALAGVAGALNAAAFYAAGFFSANMTGNLSIASDRIAIGEFPAALFFLCIILAFITGSALCATGLNAGIRRNLAGTHAYAVLVEAFCMIPLWAAGFTISAEWRSPMIILGLAGVMGFQNAIVTHISSARVRTTHISGIATDIGIELANALDIRRRRTDAKKATENGARLRLHVVTMISFFAGGVVGVLIYRYYAGLVFIVSAAFLLGLAYQSIRSIGK